MKRLCYLTATAVLVLCTTVACHKQTQDANTAASMSPEAQTPSTAPTDEPAQLALFRAAYPDLTFSATFDASASDYLITITVPATEQQTVRTGSLYWQDGRLLPESELAQKEHYWTLLYAYADDIPDPARFSQEDIERIRSFTEPQNRTEGAETPPFFYDLVYDCATRVSVESHIVKHTFLGKKTNIHERLRAPLDRVQMRIRELAATDSAVKSFIDTLASADCYSWRTISDSRKRSFHSVGIAIDVLPRGWGKKNIYWAWRRDIDPDNWMFLPLERRWMPPQAVIAAFEAEGFIWGGKWIIWDNMHFEYHPEILLQK